MRSCSSLTPKHTLINGNSFFLFFNSVKFNSVVVPVDAAAAPINTDGIPSMKIMGAAMKHVILAVADEEAERVLWWKS